MASTAGAVTSQAFRPEPVKWYKPPLIAVDCLYNSSRNVVISMITFAFVVTCATTLIVFSLQTEDVQTVEISFLSLPPATAYLGVQVSNFSVLVQHQPSQKGIPGVQVTLQMIPVQTLDLIAGIPPAYQPVALQSVNCLGSVYGLDPLQAHLQKMLCDTTNNLLGAIVTTDQNGIADFQNLVLTHGYPTKYLIMVSHNAPMDPSDATPKRVTNVIAMQAMTVLIDTPSITRATTATGALATFRVTGSFILDGAAFADAFEQAAGSGNGGSSSSGVNSTAFIAQLDAQQLIAAANVSAYVVPLNMQGITAVDAADNSLIVGYDTLWPGAAVLQSYSVIASTEVPDGYPTALNCTYDITVSIMASTNPTVFLGVYVHGTILPLQPPFSEITIAGLSESDFDNRIPSYQVLPFTVAGTANAVTGVSITAAPTSVNPNATITITVQLTGMPTGAKKTVFLFLTPNGVGGSRGSAVTHSPTRVPFQIIHPITQVTTATATLSTALSASGVSGSYTLNAVCDGITSAGMPLTITSDVSGDLSSFIMGSSDWRTPTKPKSKVPGSQSAVETLARPWTAIPTVRVLDNYGNPIAGRYGTLECTDPAVNLISLSSPSDSDGIIRFWYVLAASAPAMQTTYTVRVLADGQEADQFTVYLDSTDTTVNQLLVNGTVPTSPYPTGVALPFSLVLGDSANKPQETSAWVQITVGDGATLMCTGYGTEQPNLIYGADENGVINLHDLGCSIGGVATPQFVTLYMQWVDPNAASNISSVADLTNLEDNVNDATGFVQAGSITPVAILQLLITPRVTTVLNTNDITTCQANAGNCNIPFSVTQLLTTTDATTVSISFLAGPESYMNFYRVYPTPLVYFGSGNVDSTGKVEATAQAFPSIEGVFFVIPKVDGVTFLSGFAAVKFVSQIAHITVHTPMSWLSNDMAIGDVPQVPSITATDASGSPVQGVVAYLKFKIAGSTQIYDIASGHFEGGAFFSASNLLPMSSRSGTDGIANFTDLRFLGAPNGADITMLYCVGESTCVVSASSYTYNGDPPTIIVRDPPTSGAPGAKLAPFTVQLSNAPCLVKLQLVASSSSVIPIVLDTPTWAYSLTDTLTVSNVRLPPTLGDGTHILYAIGPGVRTPDPIKIVVSGSATAILVTQAPAADIVIGTNFYPQVKVQSNANPLPGIPVTVTSQTKSCDSTTDSCGVLSGTLTALTNKNGIANFEIKFDSAPNGKFWLVFTVTTIGSDGAASFLSSTADAAESFLGKLNFNGIPTFISKALLAKAKSLFTKILPNPGTLTEETELFNVHNPVVFVQVLVPPQLAAVSTALPKTLDVQPVIRLCDKQGNPISNQSVTFITRDSITFGLPDNVVSPTSDDNGTIRFTNLRVASALPGTYSVVFNSKGTHSKSSGTVKITSPKPAAMSDKMKVISFVVIAVLMPLLIANIPHSTWRWLPLSIVSLGLVAGVAVIGFTTYVDQNISSYVEAFIVIMVVLFAFMCAAVIALIGFQIRKAISGKKNHGGDGVEIDDESRSLHAFKYCKWLINARRDMKYGYGEHRAFLNAQAKAGFKYRVQEKIHGAGLKSIELVKLVKFTDPVNIPELECPKDITPFHIPLKFWVVVAIMLVILALMVLFSLWAVDELRTFLIDLRNNIPPPPPASVGTGWQTTAQTAIKNLCDFVAQNLPQYSWIATMLLPLSKYNFFAYAAAFYDGLKQVIDAITPALIVAHLFAFPSVLAVAIVMYKRMPMLMKKMRRGELKKYQDKASLDKADAYIGIHCVLFVFQHQMIFWVMFALSVALGCKFVTDFLIYRLSLIWISVIINQLQKLLEKTLISKFIREKLNLKHPLLNSLYSVFAAVLGVFKGLIGVIVRTAMAFGCLIFLSPALEMSVIPAPLDFLDAGSSAFYSMLAADNAFNNPIMLTAIAIFNVDTTLIKAARNEKSGDVKLFDRMSFSCHAGVASVANMARHRFNFLLATSQKRNFGSPGFTGGTAGALVSATAGELVSTKYSRIAKRWWLYYLLTRNPSIRKYRKWRIWAENNVQPLMNDSKIAVTGSTSNHATSNHRQPNRRGNTDELEMEFLMEPSNTTATVTKPPPRQVAYHDDGL